MSNLLKKSIFSKKTITLLLAIFMILPMIPPLGAYAASGTITILSHDDAGNHIPIAHNGSPIPTTDGYYVGDDGKEYPAYCIDPELPGAGEHGSYAVTLSETVTDSKILGMVLNGYPCTATRCCII